MTKRKRNGISLCFIHSLIHYSLIHSLIHPLMHSFIHSCMHAFIHANINGRGISPTVTHLNTAARCPSIQIITIGPLYTRSSSLLRKTGRKPWDPFAQKTNTSLKSTSFRGSTPPYHVECRWRGDTPSAKEEDPKVGVVYQHPSCQTLLRPNVNRSYQEQGKHSEGPCIVLIF